MAFNFLRKQISRKKFKKYNKNFKVPTMLEFIWIKRYKNNQLIKAICPNKQKQNYKIKNKKIGK